MTRRSIQINLGKGLEASPVALLVQEASKYESVIHIQSGERKVNAKSIMGMMSLNLADGDKITVLTEGEDEAKAAEGIKTFLMTSK